MAKTPNLKKLITCSAVGLMSLGLITACGGKKENTGDVKSAQEVQGKADDLANIDTKPYIKLGDYKNLNASILKKEVITDDIINSFMEYTAGAHSSSEEKPAGAAAALGDTVRIDFEGKKDGVAFAGGTAQDYELLLGSGSFIDGFEDGVVGMKVGDTKDLNLTFPDPYASEELAGQDVVFTVKLNSIYVSKPAELDDEFAKSLGLEGVSTIEEYRQYTRERLEDEAQKMYDQRLEDAMLNALLQTSEIKEIPSWLVDHYSDVQEKQLAAYAKMSGLSVDEYLSYGFGENATIEDFRKSVRDLAKTNAGSTLLVKAVADAEGISITDGDVDALMDSDMNDGQFKSREELLEYTGQTRLDYEALALRKKVMDLLKANTRIDEFDSYNSLDGMDTGTEDGETDEGGETEE